MSPRSVVAPSRLLGRKTTLEAFTIGHRAVWEGRGEPRGGHAEKREQKKEHSDQVELEGRLLNQGMWG